MISGQRQISDGSQFNHLFPHPVGDSVLIKRDAELVETIELMKRVIRDTLSDTKKVAMGLKSESDLKTCANVWNFCFKHLQYRMDDKNKEQVRRPARTWRDRKRGVDCDCMTVFIGSILTNLGIPFKIRLSRNSSELTTFGHVYPVALVKGKEVIVDCVVHNFNYEAPYLEKKDITMDLQYLNGLEGEYDPSWEAEEQEAWYPEDEYDDDLDGLNGKAQREARKQKRQEKKANKPPLKERLKKGLHVINKINPATALLRAGVLASLKLNMMNVAGKLRFSYWSDAKAQSSNMDMGKFQHLKTIRQKIEKVFYGAGGKPENFREAILTGKGNRDKKVALNGLGAVYQPIYDVNDLRSIIGTDVYFDEFSDVEHPSGMNGLGEVTAGAAIAAASGIIGTIAGLLKKLGNLFKKGTPEQEQEAKQEKAVANEGNNAPYSPAEISKYLELAKSAMSPDELPTVKRNTDPTSESDESLPSVATKSEKPEVKDFTELDEDDPEEKSTKSAKNTKSESTGMWQWMKDHPIITLGIAAGLAGGTYLAIKAIRNSQKKKGSKALNGTNGLEGVKKTTRKKTTPKKQTSKRKTRGGARKTYIRKVELS